jgi:hypothetical protein
MTLRHLGFIDLPAHVKAGGFDHAAVRPPTGQIYVAHTANDAVDVIDIQKERYLFSIGGLTGVAGALVAEPDLVFTSNRAENTVGVFTAGERPRVEKIGVGIHPNGLAYDPGRARLLAAHVGDPARPGSYTVSIIDVPARKRVADVAVAGRTRWAVYDPLADAFHVNIADPPQIVVLEPGDPVRIRRVVAIPHAGPHGLDIDVTRRRLFCACDAGVLLALDADRARSWRPTPSPAFRTWCSSTPLSVVSMSQSAIPASSRCSTRHPCGAARPWPRSRAPIPCRSTPCATSSVHSCPRAIAPPSTGTTPDGPNHLDYAA